MEPEPVEAWIVRPASIRAGTLHLAGGALVLLEGERETTRLRLAELVRVRRLRATPVIELVRRAEGVDDEPVLIYFAKPPGTGAWHEQRMGAPRGGLERAAGMLRLRAENRERKHVVRAWEAAIREAVGA